MAQRTIGYHIVKTAYGLWLPGDERGSWSAAWDDQIGFIEPHMLHPGDPVRKRMATERMIHPPVRLGCEMIAVVVKVLDACQQASPWSIAAVSIEHTHLHLLMTYNPRDLDGTIKWMTQRMTRAIHECTAHAGPVWARSKWRAFIFDQPQWANTMQYIEAHNVRRGLPPRPYPFITP